MSNTPKTDAAIIEFEYSEIHYGGVTLENGSKQVVEPEFARELENQLQKALQLLVIAQKEIAKFRSEAALWEQRYNEQTQLASEVITQRDAQKTLLENVGSLLQNERRERHRLQEALEYWDKVGLTATTATKFCEALSDIVDCPAACNSAGVSLLKRFATNALLNQPDTSLVSRAVLERCEKAISGNLNILDQCKNHLEGKVAGLVFLDTAISDLTSAASLASAELAKEAKK